MIWLIRYCWPRLIDKITRRKRLHAHKCDECGYVWRHTSAAAACKVSHTCPKCGSGPYWHKAETPPAPWC